ncbi:putative carbonic anhydrase 3 [Amphiura filiformis]|uniref:putative carbonic anhydrase 3 n=1 Tax=Amphiura filiformis TaxID=82378 RepID=UPI003B210C5B
MDTNISMLSTLFLALLFSLHSTDAAPEWGYKGDSVVAEDWATVHANCGGESQSPINIDTYYAKEMEFDAWKFTNYDVLVDNETSIMNNGHTIQVNPGTYTAGSTTISGGGLPSVYSFLQLHFHWAETNDAGSEHTRNGNAYPVEMHLVHWDSGNYAIPPLAVTSAKGLAVLGVWFEVGEENPAFDSMLDAISETNVMYKTPNLGSYVFPESALFSLGDLLPADTTKFYRYDGSLTTPNCYESVVWTVFSDPIQMSEEQIEKFRATFQNEPEPNPIPENYTAPEELPIGLNYRPVQDLGDRTVYKGFATLSAPESTVPSTTAGATSRHFDTYTVFLLSIVHYIFWLSEDMYKFPYSP